MPIDQSKFDKQHFKNLDKYSKKVRSEYLRVINEVSKLAEKLSLNNANQLFLRSNPEVSKKINKLLEGLFLNVKGITLEGINAEWDLAVEKNNELALFAFGKVLDELPEQFKNKYLSGANEARRNFVERKIKGLGLSDRIWNNTQQFKQELELALEYGINKGQSAASIARDIKTYLNEHNKLFRRVKDEQGILRLSKAAKAYNPGRGKYRSSYKNAFRLTRNETNFSYEAAQHAKNQEQDFVVGIEIKVSPSHNPADDKGGISCLSLEGKYPKEFDFTYKWHVNCKCTSFTVLKTRDELDSDLDKILAGEKPNTPSKKAVYEKPKNFNQYIIENPAKFKKPGRTFVKNT